MCMTDLVKVKNYTETKQRFLFLINEEINNISY